VVRALAVVACVASVADAAPREVRGVVTRGEHRPIAGATVYTEHGAITTTDVDGYFVLATDDRELTVTAVGYEPRTIAAGDGILDIELAPASGAEVIQVVGKAPEQTKPLSYQLTADEVRTIPGAGNDVLRAAQVLPGVARIPYAFGGLVLRGMSPRDTEIYLDGVEVPLAFHFGGITSFYPSGMLADLTLVSGGFDASYGRAQGGLVTLTTREPRTDRWRMGGSIGLLDSSVEAEGPLATGGILIGLRRSYFDTVADPFVEDDIPLPSYWDWQIRTSFGDPRTGGRITPMFFGSIDRIASDKISVTSAFARIAVPYLRTWGPLTLHVVPWLGWNQLSFEDDSDEQKQTFKRPTFPGGARAELVRDFAWGHLRGGAELESGYLANTEVGVQAGSGSMHLNGSTTIAWSDVALWSEARYKIDGERMAVKPGVRVEAYGLTGEVVVDPRLNIHERLTDTLTLRQAVGRFHQPPTPSDVDPKDGNPRLDSSYVDQASLGLEADLAGGVFASITGFYDYGRHFGVEVQNPRPGSSPPDPNRGGLGPTFALLLDKELGFPIYRLDIGRAKSIGLELLVKRNVGPWFFLLAYTLEKAQRTDADADLDPVKTGGWRPFELDQRHNLNVAASLQLARWRFGARLQLVSGNPYSPSVLVGSNYVQQAWAGRLPTFFSLDLRADRRWHRCWGDINLYIDIQNATNYGNVEARELDGGLQREVDTPGLPIIPFIGVEFLPLK
jgi:hypothetical protein